MRIGVILSASLLVFIYLVVFHSSQTLNVFLYGFSLFIAFMAVLRLLAVLITIKRSDDYSPHTVTDAVIPIHTGPSCGWPHFTVLVPLYQEAHMVTNLMQNLSKIDYPANKIDIFIVTEADDLPTCRAVKHNLRHVSHELPFHIFEVPPSQPRTKPKALNATLASLPKHKRGDIITVYDAEDRPHPGQLKQAAQRFMAEPELAALQAPLGYYNDRDNLLTAQFGLEYAALFNVWNPALAKLGIPFTLGGTSNHIRRDILELCGGWDADNVTEDADLSFRIHALRNPERKLKIGTIDLPTAEEAVSTHKDWTAQRSRWLKGFMQTWRVHMRVHKFAPDGSHLSFMTRIKNLFALQITVGATLLAAYLHVPSLIIMGCIYIANSCGLISFTWPTSLLTIMITGYSAAILTGFIGAIRAKKPHLIIYAPLMPLYWLLYFRPALIAAYEIIAAPTHWRKTTHVGQITSHVGTNETKPLPIDNPALERARDRLI